MKDQTCCFAGHRIIPEIQREDIQKRLEEEIINLIHQGVRYFCTGGELGFDTISALAVLKLKAEFPHIQLILALSCVEQVMHWKSAEGKIYNLILNSADEVVFTSKNYCYGCIQKRNRYLVDSSGVCICCLTDSKGGTAYTVGYARQKGLRVIDLAAGSPSPASRRVFYQ